MKNSSKKTLLLGVFVIIGLIIFTLAVYFIGNKQNLFGDTKKIVSVFKNIDGLQEGNNVRFSGVNVGTVRDITIINDTAILVSMQIDGEIIKLIKKSSYASISSDGLVGSMIVNIVRDEEGPEEPLEPEDTIRSISKITSVEMLNTLSTTNENAALLTADLLEITNSINEGEGVLGELLKNEKMAEEIKQSITNFQNTTQAALYTINKFNGILSEINFDESIAGVLLKDTASAEKVTGIIKNLERSTEEVNEITLNLKNFSQNLKEGEGALNYLTQDTSFVNDLDSTLHTLEEASTNFNQIMEATQQSFLFRGYFRKLERQESKESDEN